MKCRLGPRRFWRRTGVAAAAVLVLAVFAVSALYQRDIRAARRAAVEGSRIAATRAGPIEYGEAGDGIPALVIHGSGGGYDQGLYIGEMIGNGLRVIAPSRFGYLRTPLSKDVSPEAQADAHAALLDSIAIPRAIVVGVSAGAPSAIEFALRHPERTTGLILMVPMAYAPDVVPTLDTSRSSKVMLEFILRGADFAYWAASHLARSAVVRFLGVPPEIDRNAPPAERADVTRVMNSVEPLSQRLEGLRLDSALALPARPLERIRAPTLVVTSRDDLFKTLSAAQFTADHISGAKLVVFDSGGHLFVGRRDEVQTAVQEFLAASGLQSPR